MARLKELLKEAVDAQAAARQSAQSSREEEGRSDEISILKNKNLSKSATYNSAVKLNIHSPDVA